MIDVAVIALLSTIAMPNLARARDGSRLNMVYSNLRALESAKDQWAIDNNAATGAPITDMTVLNSYFRGGALQPVLHELYVANAVGIRPEADLPAGIALGPYGAGAAISLP
jgi:type II secretory pathway pseudopilin PulG